MQSNFGRHILSSSQRLQCKRENVSHFTIEMASAERVNEKVRALPLLDSYSSYACRRCVHSSAVFRMAVCCCKSFFRAPRADTFEKKTFEKEKRKKQANNGAEMRCSNYYSYTIAATIKRNHNTLLPLVVLRAIPRWLFLSYQLCRMNPEKKKMRNVWYLMQVHPAL